MLYSLRKSTAIQHVIIHEICKNPYLIMYNVNTSGSTKKHGYDSCLVKAAPVVGYLLLRVSSP